MKTAKHILPIIVIAQFCCTSLWFAGNAIIKDLTLNFNLNESALSQITSAVQFGFISGTLLFALYNVVDRISASKVFFVSALIAGLVNLCLLIPEQSLISLLILRFIVGFFLGGIYPVGMKIASDYFEKGLGKSLSYLVGALVLGTAFPHLLNANFFNFNWKMVILLTSLLSIAGGILILTQIPNGPFYKQATNFDVQKIFNLFKNIQFRKVAFGYFGHMWELYTFWTFVPLLLKAYLTYHITKSFNIALYSFVIIAIGSLGCVLGGNLSHRFGTLKIAKWALFISGICCLVSPLLFYINSEFIYIGFLSIWGMAVIADSPLFSSLVAQKVEATSKGTALTIVNCFGYTLTILSILIFNAMLPYCETQYLFLILAIGPLFGLYNLRKKSLINL